jgi:hypothetical protein
MQIRKPLIYWFLVMLFIWSVARDFQMIVMHQTSADHAVLRSPWPQ